MKIRIETNDARETHAHAATRIALQFVREYPDRIGFHQGVVYTTKCGCSETHDLSFYVYRTPKGAIVVRE